jgi:hypothetical protein
MSDIDEMFRSECKEVDVDYAEFPYEFLEGSRINFPSVIKALMWILKKRQDKMMGITTFDKNGNVI